MQKSNFLSIINKILGIFVLITISLSILIALTLWLLRDNNADAKISSFYSTTCLGGWKNTDEAVGEPNVSPDGDVENYGDSNSASISNANAQIFCGGFEGSIPNDEFQNRVILRFSWAMEQTEIPQIIDVGESVEEIQDESVTDETASTTDSETELPENISETNTDSESSSESVLEPEPVSEPEPDEITPVESVPDEPTTEESPSEEPAAEESDPSEEVTFLDRIFSKVYAQEESDSNVPSDALLEILYTLDGDKWETIGFVSNISNNVSFEMPSDIFTSIEDLKRVQIAIRTVPTFDNVPIIYLDSVWLDVEHQKSPVAGVTKGISGFKVFVLTQEKLESTLNSWFISQNGIVVDDLKVENYGGGGYLVVISYHTVDTSINTSTRFKLIVGENPEVDAQTFLSSLNSSNTVRSVAATTGSYSGSDTTITVPIIFIVYE